MINIKPWELYLGQAYTSVVLIQNYVAHPGNTFYSYIQTHTHTHTHAYPYRPAPIPITYIRTHTHTYTYMHIIKYIISCIYVYRFF